MSCGKVNMSSQQGREREKDTDRMSLYIDCIIRASACLTATSRPFASHSQAREAGAWQMAQSGSILITPFRDLELYSLVYMV